MANKIGVPSIGALGDVHSTALNVVGLEVPTDDGGIAIYLAGSGTLSANTWVTFDELGATTILTADAVGRVAIAQGAAISGTWGWFIIVSGNAGVTGKCDGIADNKSCYIDGTTGRVDDASVAGDLVFNAWSRSTDSSNLATFQINRPFVQDGAYLA